jgi:putative membrane protein
MSWLIGLLITVIVMTIAFLIISKLPIGVEIDSLQKAFISAVIFGILNWLVSPLVGFFKWTFILGPIAFVINVIIFGIAAMLVEGFRLRWGIWSAVLGAIALAIVNHLLSTFLVRFTPL